MFFPGTPVFPEWMSVYDKLATCPVCILLLGSWQLEMDNSLFNDLSTTASDVSTLQPIRDPEFLINVFILLVLSAMLLSQETTTKVTALAQQSDKTDLQNTKHSLLNSMCSNSAYCWWGCPGTCIPPSYQHTLSQERLSPCSYPQWTSTISLLLFIYRSRWFFPDHCTNHPIRQSHSKSHILWTDRQIKTEYKTQ